MNPSQVQVLSRFFDGEPVDPALLAESLADPEAASCLAQWAAVRAWVREDDSRPSGRFYEAVAPLLRPSRRRRAFWSPLVRPAIAASLVLVGAAMGFEYRSSLERARPGPDTVARPIETGRTTVPSPAKSPTSRELKPGAAAASAVAARAPAPIQQAVPIPNTRLRFASWRETDRGGEDD